MRKAVLSALLVAIGTCIQAQTSTLDALVETKRFQSPSGSVQLDVNVSVLGGTATWKLNDRGTRQAQVDVLMLVEKDTTIVDYRKASVLGPERTDTATTDFLIDEHFLLAPGEYVLSVELSDVHGPASNLSQWRGPLVIPAKAAGISFSDLLLTNGSRTDAQGAIVPNPFAGTYYPAEVGRLGFYTELYGTDQQLGKDSLFMVTTQIETFETKQVKGEFKRQQRKTSAATVPVSVEFPIDGLPSGNYLLVVEVADRSGSMLARQEQFFQRNNPLRYDITALESVSVTNTFADAITDRDTLAENIACLRPIATDLERRMIDARWKDKDLTLMKRFFYTFWANRDGFDPERAWNKYNEQVVMANKMYGCRNQKGYENDRGITFLKYGLPSTVVDQSQDNRQLPYLIWHYYKAGRYSDKRFVFWQQNVGIGCWELMHSEIPGEIKNYNWQSQLTQPLGPASLNRTGTPEGIRMDDNFDRPH